MATVSDDQTKRILGDNIRQNRIARGLSMSELARRAGSFATTIKEIEESVRMPGIGLVTRIADALDVGVEELLTPNKKRQKTA